VSLVFLSQYIVVFALLLVLQILEFGDCILFIVWAFCYSLFIDSVLLKLLVMFAVKVLIVMIQLSILYLVKNYPSFHEHTT